MSKDIKIPNHHYERWSTTWQEAFAQGQKLGYSIGFHDGEVDAFDRVWQLIVHHLRTNPEPRWMIDESGVSGEVPHDVLRSYAIADSISKAMRDCRDGQIHKFMKVMSTITKETTNA